MYCPGVSLYASQDARLGSLDMQLEGRYASHGVVLRRMFREERLRKEELAAFQACLMPHQKAVRLVTTLQRIIQLCASCFIFKYFL